MKNIKELKEMIRFVVSLANVMSDIMADGKVSLLELPKLLKPFSMLKPALENWHDVGAEFKDLSPEELEEIKAYLIAELDLKQEGIEVVIEKAFAVIVELGKIILSFKK